MLLRLTLLSLFLTGVLHAQGAVLGVRITATEGDSGAQVAQVLEDSAADVMGLRVGDVILAVGGTETPDPAALKKTVSDRKPGEIVRIKLLRNGEATSLRGVLGRSADGSRAEAPSPLAIIPQQDPQQVPQLPFMVDPQELPGPDFQDLERLREMVEQQWQLDRINMPHLDAGPDTIPGWEIPLPDWQPLLPDFPHQAQELDFEQFQKEMIDWKRQFAEQMELELPQFEQRFGPHMLVPQIEIPHFEVPHVDIRSFENLDFGPLPVGTQRSVKLRYPESTPANERERLIQEAQQKYGDEVEIEFSGQGTMIQIQQSSTGIPSQMPKAPRMPKVPKPATRRV